MRTIKDLDINGKKIIIRCDFNVPLDEKGKITEDLRIKDTLPTIRYALEKAEKIILMSHLGRPKGKDPKLSLKVVCEKLSGLLKTKVVMVNDCIGEQVKKQIETSNEKIFLLENLRFYPQEESNDPGFARQLANLGDAYINDAFGASHRKHSSVYEITKYLPSAAGLLLEKEIKTLNEIFQAQRPLVIVLGGAKVSDKIGIIEKLNADKLLIGGAMASTFIKAMGFEIGKSKHEPEKLEYARTLPKDKIMLPVDFIVAKEAKHGAKKRQSETIAPDEYALDIGEQSILNFSKELKKARTIVWNGPMGLFEIEEFSMGTKKIGEIIAKNKGQTIAGGGDTMAAIIKLKIKGIKHVSTGGGAMLEFLEAKTLPAIEVLN